ncbi:PorT family protein [Dyadobacter sediminis]|uniref:PorT family protein n=2 Tax=Dyadobacter sediminis TaxID=1493691 RepID=A0A5R9K891_9BACT|nr:PorT family protein [Dyadobacter sediminis]
MDPSEINNFEDQWRKAFQEASETPPQSVWEGIEAHLDKDDKNTIVPLWWQSPKLWYAAASIAAILLVGAGIWFLKSGEIHNKANVEIAADRVPESNGDSSKNLPDQTGKSEVQDNALAVGPNKKTDSLVKPDSKTNTNTERAAFRNSSQHFLAKSTSRNKKSTAAADESQKIINPSSISDSERSLLATTDVNDSISEITGQQTLVSSQALAALPYSDLEVHFQKRYVFFRPESNTEEAVKPVKNKEYWAGLGLMPASFNPDLKIKEAPLAFTSNSVSNRKSVSGSSQPGASYAIQTQGGMRLSKHWSVELGVSYLQGNSSYEGGGYVLSAKNYRSANVLENAFADLSSNPNTPNNSYDFLNGGSTYIDVSKTVSNNYQYLQLPVQAGFTINPDKKLSYSVLGGMMANFFLSNDLESASGEIITTTASDDIYRHVNWSATTGLRFNYRLSSKWKANLTGSYQKAVSSGFRSNQNLDLHPVLYGVSWGVRYSF